MRVAFAYPSYWPYVRRGGERHVHDLAVYLASRGHEVHVIASTPGHSRRADDRGVKVTYIRQLSHPLLYRYSPVLRQLAYATRATRVLLGLKVQVAHFMTYSNIPWVPLLRRGLDLPYLFQAIVRRDRSPRNGWTTLFNQTILHADRVVALTRGGAEALSKEFNVPCGVLPPPVDTSHFRRCARRESEHPEVLFTADLADAWKGGTLLLRAWNRVHRECPRARLVLAGPFGVAGVGGRLYPNTMLTSFDLVKSPAARDAIEIRGTGALSSLPEWYSKASVTVLPSIHEGFGLVLTESLACGTPVVGSSRCGPGEIITNPEIGATVDLADQSDLESATRADELADAILTAIELSRRPGIEHRCRAWAAQWSLDVVGPEYESLLESVASRRAGAVSPC
jgi:glycosyltransferase involved in cell wall biosynthesis